MSKRASVGMLVLATTIALLATVSSASAIKYPDSTSIAIPSSTVATLTLTNIAPEWRGYYVTHVDAGQTISLATTAEAGSEPPDILVEAPTFPFVMLSERMYSYRRDLFFAAPESGDYHIIVGASDPATYTLSAASVAPLRFRFAPVSVERWNKRVRHFSTSLSPHYDGFYSDGPNPPAAYSPLRFVVERWRRSRWRTYCSVNCRVPLDQQVEPLAATVRLPAGKFRVRLRIRDVAHTRPLYGRYAYFRIR